MNRIAVAVGIAVALCAAPSARAQSVEDQIKKLETDRAAAVVKGDVAAIASQTAEDYTLINANGELSGKAQTMDAIKSGSIKLSANDLSDVKVRVYGNTAVVTGKANAKGVIGGRELKGPVMFTRVYVKKDGKWQSVAFQQTPIAAP
jgi:ketosteroid isomerase-like protein